MPSHCRPEDMSMSDRKALLTTREVGELLGVSRRTLYRWIKRGLLTPRLQYCGGTHLRFAFLSSELITFIDRMPLPKTAEDPKILQLLARRRLYIKKAAAARMAKKSDKARGEIVR